MRLAKEFALNWFDVSLKAKRKFFLFLYLAKTFSDHRTVLYKKYYRANAFINIKVQTKKNPNLIF